MRDHFRNLLLYLNLILRSEFLNWLQIVEYNVDYIKTANRSDNPLVLGTIMQCSGVLRYTSQAKTMPTFNQEENELV